MVSLNGLAGTDMLCLNRFEQPLREAVIRVLDFKNPDFVEFTGCKGLSIH